MKIKRKRPAQDPKDNKKSEQNGWLQQSFLVKLNRPCISGNEPGNIRLENRELQVVQCILQCKGEALFLKVPTKKIKCIWSGSRSCNATPLIWRLELSR